MCKLTRSFMEEVLAALWLIAALQAWDCGFYTFAKILFAKALFDLLCSLIAAVVECKGKK